MFYVNGWLGKKEYRKTSSAPEGALLYLQDALERGYERVVVMDRSGRTYSGADLRALVDRTILPGA